MLRKNRIHLVDGFNSIPEYKTGELVDDLLKLINNAKNSLKTIEFARRK